MEAVAASAVGPMPAASSDRALLRSMLPKWSMAADRVGSGERKVRAVASKTKTVCMGKEGDGREGDSWR